MKKSNLKPNQKLINAVFNYCNFHSRRLSEHYVHAVTKHPYFCDVLFAGRRFRADGGADRHLELARMHLASRVRGGISDMLDVADCEVAEMFSAFARGDYAAAVEECYDVIAVLLRAIDVLEKRQDVGKVKRNRRKDNGK